jgi:hypothetical protein
VDASHTKKGPPRPRHGAAFIAFFIAFYFGIRGSQLKNGTPVVTLDQAHATAHPISQARKCNVGGWMLLGNRVPGLVVRKYIQSALEDKLSTSDFGATPGTPMMAAFIPSASSRDQQALRGISAMLRIPEYEIESLRGSAADEQDTHYV